MIHFKNTNKSYSVIVGMLMLAVLGLLAGTYPASGADVSKTDFSGTQIVAVEEVLGSPENFSGTMGVTGKVMSIEQSRSLFFLGCKGAISCACLEMPVEFSGQMPEIGNEVVVFGEISTTDAGKFVFKAQEVKPQ